MGWLGSAGVFLQILLSMGYNIGLNWAGMGLRLAYFVFMSLSCFVLDP